MHYFFLNIVFPAKAEYSYFSADIRLKYILVNIFIVQRMSSLFSNAFDVCMETK